MKTELWIFVLATLATEGCSPARTAAPEPKQTARPVALGASSNQPYYLYRGVRTRPGTSEVDWSRLSFELSGIPRSLSLFNSASAQAGFPCILRVAVTRHASGPAIPGEIASFEAPNPAFPGGGNPGPWNAIFDDNPAGHWSIPKSAIVAGPVSNNHAAAIVSMVFRQMEETGAVTVLNGTAPDCQR